MTSAVTQSSDVINYLTLDLDEPVVPGDRVSCGRDDGECSSAARRGRVDDAASTTLYDDIDWFRTQALNDMRRQVETSRKSSNASASGTGCLLAVSK